MSSIRGTRQHKKETCPTTVKPMKDMTKKHKKNKQMKQATAVEPTKGVAKKNKKSKHAEQTATVKPMKGSAKNSKKTKQIEPDDDSQPLPNRGISTGTVRQWGGKWGFISDHNCPSYDLFFHHSECEDPAAIKQATTVSYTVEVDVWRNKRNSKYKATKLSLVSSKAGGQPLPSKAAIESATGESALDPNSRPFYPTETLELTPTLVSPREGARPKRGTPKWTRGWSLKHAQRSARKERKTRKDKRFAKEKAQEGAEPGAITVEDLKRLTALRLASQPTQQPDLCQMP